MKKLLLVVAMLAFSATISMAGTVVCTEDPVTGCVTTLPGGLNFITIASDGEAPFDPFGAGYDTSDGINIATAQFGLPSFVQYQGNWNQLGPETWVLPACNIVCENGNTYEPVGYWYLPGYIWTIPPTLFMVHEADGTESDTIWLGNFGPNGNAAIAFSSTPEPSSLLLLSSGLVGAASFARRRFFS